MSNLDDVTAEELVIELLKRAEEGEVDLTERLCYALRCAGWPDDRPIWTGSCPCQPFSGAGKRVGFDDDRHLWPVWFKLIDQCKPSVVIGEQVASSGTVGKANQNVPEMSNREAVFGVLRELQGQPTLVMQGLRAGCGKGPEALQPRQDESCSQEVEGRKARACSHERSEAPRENERVAFRSGPERHSEKGRCWNLRDDGDPVRSNDTAFMERGVVRSDSAGRRIHSAEHPSGAVFAKCHGEHVGHHRILEIASAILEKRRDRSNDLSRTLAKRLRIVTEQYGSTMYALTWSEHITPSGYVIPRCRASAVRTSDKGFTGWPAPTAKIKAGGEYSDPDKAIKRALGPHSNDLRDFVQLAGWPTPCQQDGPNGGPGQGTDRLPGAVMLAGWTTPQAHDATGRSKTQKAKHGTKHGCAYLVRDVDKINLDQPARLTASGEMLIGSTARMKSGGQLNPEHSRWLMGLPPEWASCAPTETLSSLRKRRFLLNV